MKTISLCILLALSFSAGYAQLSIERQVIATSGQTLASGSLSQDFTLGESATRTVTSGSIHLTQGFQQGNLGPSSTVATLLADNEWVIYPQPARDRLFIRLDRPHIKSIRLEVFDLLGRTLVSDQSAFTSDPTLSQLNVQTWSTGTYLLRLLDDDGHLLMHSKWTKH